MDLTNLSFCLQGGNAAGLARLVSSSGYTLDASPPDVGVVFDGPQTSSGEGDVEYWSSVDVIEGHWRGFSDPHTDIAQYWWGIGTCSGCTNVQPFISVGRNQGRCHIHTYTHNYYIPGCFKVGEGGGTNL